MRRASFSTLIAGILLLTWAGTAQAQWEEQVRAKLESVRQQVAGDGFSLAQDYHINLLTAGESARVSVSLQGGISYQIVGAADNDCNDLDLTLYDAQDNLLDTDIALDALPWLVVTPNASGTYVVEVDMVECTTSDCYYGFGIFAEGAQQQLEGGVRLESGTLATEDNTLPDGEYMDQFMLPGS